MKTITLMALLPATIAVGVAAPTAVTGAQRLSDVQLARMYGGAGNGNGNGNVGNGNGNLNSGSNNGNGNFGSNNGNGNATDNNGNFDGSNKGNGPGASVNSQALVHTATVTPAGPAIAPAVATPPAAVATPSELAAPNVAAAPAVSLNGVLIPSTVLPTAVPGGLNGVLVPANPLAAVGVVVPR